MALQVTKVIITLIFLNLCLDNSHLFSIFAVKFGVMAKNLLNKYVWLVETIYYDKFIVMQSCHTHADAKLLIA